MMEEIKYKNILILGFGKEGNSTYNYIRKHNTKCLITIMDKNYRDINIKEDNLKIIDVDLSVLNKYDIIFKSPGISFKDIDVSNIKNKITSQTDILFKYKRNHTIGITGTKGKSTTSSLIYHMLNSLNISAYLVGNIGKPILDIFDEIKDDLVVCETSSHQLEFVKHSPKYAIILNMYEEHLDYYKTKEDYFNAKMNITLYQKKADYLLYTSNSKILNKHIRSAKLKSNLIDITLNDNDTIIKDNKTTLKGEHNLIDILFALNIIKILNLDITKSIESLNSFKSLEHRLELVGTFNDITYYNDSIATIPEATINGIKALGGVDTLIFGGLDRKIDYKEFVEYLNKSNISNFICLPLTGHIIYEKLKSNNKFKVKDVDEAVMLASKITKKGSICLLSPAAASYGFYKNFEERGNRYKNKIISLKK